jgi:hypothetical protein
MNIHEYFDCCARDYARDRLAKLGKVPARSRSGATSPPNQCLVRLAEGKLEEVKKREKKEKKQDCEKDNQFIIIEN